MVIKLPAPVMDSGFSVERAINERMSIRSYKDTPLTLKEVSHSRWAGSKLEVPKMMSLSLEYILMELIVNFFDLEPTKEMLTYFGLIGLIYCIIVGRNYDWFSKQSFNYRGL